MRVSMVVGERFRGNRIFSTDDNEANRNGCGFPNIAKHIDPECFPDRSVYRDCQDLYEYMAGRAEQENGRRIEAVNSCLRSEAAAQFTNDCFARAVADQIVGDNR